ncbi:hypothetical protein EV122DRAFT_251063 [Schizophyllum commune]
MARNAVRSYDLSPALRLVFATMDRIDARLNFTDLFQGRDPRQKSLPNKKDPPSSLSMGILSTGKARWPLLADYAYSFAFQPISDVKKADSLRAQRDQKRRVFRPQQASYHGVVPWRRGGGGPPARPNDINKNATPHEMGNAPGTSARAASEYSAPTSGTAPTSRPEDDDDDSSDSDSSESEDEGHDASGVPDQNVEATNDAAEADSEREDDSDVEDEDEDTSTRAADATSTTLQTAEGNNLDDDLEAALDLELSQSLDCAEDESDEDEWEEATVPEVAPKGLTLTAVGPQPSSRNERRATAPDSNAQASIATSSTNILPTLPKDRPSPASAELSASPSSSSADPSPLTPPEEIAAADEAGSKSLEGQSRRVKDLAEKKRRRQTPTTPASTPHDSLASSPIPSPDDSPARCPDGDYPSCGGRCQQDLTPAEAGLIHGSMRKPKELTFRRYYRRPAPSDSAHAKDEYYHLHDPERRLFTAKDIMVHGFKAGPNPELLAKLLAKKSSPPARAIKVVPPRAPSTSTGSLPGRSAVDVIDLTNDEEDNAPSIPPPRSSWRKTRRPRIQAPSLASSSAGPSDGSATSQTRDAPRQSSFAKPRNGNSSAPVPAQSYSPYAYSSQSTTPATQFAPTSLIGLVDASAISSPAPRSRGANSSFMSTANLLHQAFAADSRSTTTQPSCATAPGAQANPWTSSLWLPQTQATTSSHLRLPPVPPPSAVPQVQSPVPSDRVEGPQLKQQLPPSHAAGGPWSTQSRRPQATRHATQTSQPATSAKVSANASTQARTSPASRCGTPKLKAQHSFTLSGAGPLTSAGQPLPALSSEPSLCAPHYYQPQWSAYQQRQSTTEAPTPISQWAQARGPGYSNAAPPATSSAAAYGYSHYAVAPISGQKRKNEDGHARNSRRTKW